MKFLLILSLIISTHNIFAMEKIATFAGGCFWCMEEPFESQVGVSKVISGYAGGLKKNPEYKEVASGLTKHREAVQVYYNPELISYERLLEIFWMNINPLDNGGQFVDRGFQYSSAIFYQSNAEKQLANLSKKIIDKSKRFKTKIKTPVIAFTTFYPAEEYHQDYYKKSILTKTKYKYYRNASGRDDFINKYWKKGDRLVWNNQYIKPSESELKKKLTSLQYKVTQEEGTERPFSNEFWDNKREGVYVDIVTGEPLFHSKDKYKSGTGWPSFTRPYRPNNIIELKDNKLLSERIEVRSRYGDSHLGHVFYDGPAPTGLRYCINSAALRFVPIEEFKKN